MNSSETIKMDKAQYNREYAEQRYDGFREQRDRLTLEIYGGKCYLCGATKDYQNYHFHHLTYGPESNYDRTSNSMWVRQLRLKEAVEHPERFVLLCQKCHRLITSLGSSMLNTLEIMPVDPEKMLDLVVREVRNRLGDKRET